MSGSFPEARASLVVPPVAAPLSGGPRAHVFARRRPAGLGYEAEAARELPAPEKFGKPIEVKLYDGDAKRSASAVINVPPRPATAPAPAAGPTPAAPPD